LPREGGHEDAELVSIQPGKNLVGLVGGFAAAWGDAEFAAPPVPDDV
jgi:hypothetical protein